MENDISFHFYLFSLVMTPVRKILKAGGGLVWDRRAGKCLSIFVSASDSYTKLLRADWDCHLSQDWQHRQHRAYHRTERVNKSLTLAFTYNFSHWKLHHHLLSEKSRYFCFKTEQISGGSRVAYVNESDLYQLWFLIIQLVVMVVVATPHHGNLHLII